MCLTKDTFTRLSRNMDHIHQRFQNDLHNLEEILGKLKQQPDINDKKGILAYLRSNRLIEYYCYVDFLVSVLYEGKSMEYVYYWESMYGVGCDFSLVSSLYSLWWKRVNHCQHYCVNPMKFGQGLMYFAMYGPRALLHVPCKDLKEQRIKDYLILGFVKHNAAIVIQRNWHAYVRKKNECATKIQNAWRL